MYAMEIRKTVFLTLALVVCAASALAVELRYAHVGHESDLQNIFAEEAAKVIAKATDGRVTFRIFPNSQLGGAAEMLDGVKMGSIAIANTEYGSIATLVEEAGVFSAPFIFRDGEHALKATDPKTSKLIQRINERLVKEDGIRIIGRCYRGARNISSSYPVKSPADLAGKPFRAVPQPVWVSMVKGFTAIPTPVEATEIMTALMTGLVVGQENPLTMINANKLYEVQPYISLTNHMQSVLAVFINEKFWQAMSAEDQGILEKSFDDMVWQSLQWAKETDDLIVKELTDKKITFFTKENGLDIPAFEKSVLDQINRDFPSFTPLIDEIKAIK